MMTRQQFERQIKVMVLIDRIFRIVTPFFCALVILGALAAILWRVTP